MVKYDSSFLEELRTRIPVSKVVSRVVKLQRKGSSPQFLGLCPFHKEKTPSFTVNDDKGFYHCFGCGTSGDIIDFEMQINRLSFVEAIEKLANEAGMPIPKSSPIEVEKEKKKATLYQILDLSAKFFYDMLYQKDGEEALAYLQKRGLDDDTIAKFRLGFAPKDTGALKTYLLANGIDAEQMLKAGLTKKSDNNDNDYSYFRNRVMFPISDAKGRIIAFGGRIMDDGQPKYLNSPETEIFNKGENLYGLSQAIKSIRENDTAILVEGYMDVISLVKAGINYTVAPLGTALTEKQVQKLWFYTSEPCLCFDSDKAGRSAMIKSALRTLPILKPGYSVKFIFLNGAKDPDEFILGKGKSAFLEIEKRTLSDVLWEYMVDNYRFDTPEQKAKFEIEIDSHLAVIGDIKVKNYYLNDFKKRLRERLYERKEKFYQKTDKFYPKTKEVTHPVKIAVKTGDDEAKMLIAYCLLFPKIAFKFIEEYYNYQLSTIETTEIGNYLNKIMDILTIQGEIDETTLKEKLEINQMSTVFSAVSSEIELILRRFRKKFKDNYEKEKLVESDFLKRLRNFKIFSINKRITAIKSLATDNNNASKEEKESLWNEYILLINEKEKLENINF